MIDLGLLKQLKADIIANKEKFNGTVKGSQGAYGFACLEDGREIYLPPEQMKRLLPGDKVSVTIEQEKNKKHHAEPVKCIESPLKKLIGQLAQGKNRLFFRPDHSGFNRPIQLELPNDGKAGDFVQLEITEHPFKSGLIKGKITSLIGNKSEPKIETRYLIAKHKLATDFSDEVKKELEQMTEEKLQHLALERKDLTLVNFITIDSASSMDLDDALFAEKTDSGWRLQVAIADPSAWFSESSALNKVAKKRAVTLYFPSLRVPMLPAKLAEGLCSLLPDQLRLAMVCSLEINTKGQLQHFNFTEACIRSKAKLTYSQVRAYLDEGEVKPTSPIAPVTEILTNLHQLSLALNQARKKQAITHPENEDFQIEFDEKEKIRAIHKTQRDSAQKLVEECMLITNLAAAKFMSQNDSGLFINHPGFRKERLADLKKILNKYQPRLNEIPSTTEQYKELLEQLKKLEPQNNLGLVINRYLEPSHLGSQPAAHFGLGFPCYTNFTSPLRKYFDLCTHRIIKQIINVSEASAPNYSETFLRNLQKSNQSNRRIINELHNWLKCQFMVGKKKDTFKAKIVNLNTSGFVVRLEETGIEGFVSTKNLKQKLTFDCIYYRLFNKKQEFNLGQHLSVRIFEINLNMRNIQFIPVDE